MTYPKLKPCPECGQEMTLFQYESGWWRAECDPCPETVGGIYIGSCEGRKLDAIRAHNSRTAPERNDQ